MKIKDKIAKIVAVKDYSLISGIDNNTIVVTATQNLKKKNLFSGAKSIMSFSDLTKFASNNIDNKNNLNSTEFRYIIHKTIEETIEPERVKVYQNCVPGLEELYTKLLINNISSDNVNSIKFEKYTFVEKDIFEIYKKVRENLGKSKQRIFKESLIQEACEMLSQNNKVAFVGFVFFNDIQEAIIRGIESPELIFINKDNDFIANELIKPLIDKIGRECKVEIVDQDVAGDFYEIEKKIFTKNIVQTKVENNVELYEPFSNREEEFLFIAKQISESIKQKNLKPNEIETELLNYAVVLTKDKNELSKTLNDAFGQYGVFIPNEKGYTNIKPIYYSKQEFLQDKILAGKKTLSYVEKVQLFENFKRIKVAGGNLQSEDFPIGKFILEVYKVVANDLSIDSFKTLINTQWYLNKPADNVAIQDFYKLEAYFENLTSMEQWKNEINNLIALKKQINKEVDFNKHPLFVASEKSLKYIKEYLEFLDALVEKLKVDGNVRSHIKHLLKTFDLLNLKLPDKEEQTSLETFIEILQSIESSDNTEMDYKYFAEHIKELIEQYSWAKKMDSEALRLPVVNMENYTKYDYVFFPMFEDNKYPRILKLDFPYTDNIVEIIKKIGLNLQKNQEMAYHLKMSRHIFKNVFGFVNKKITFTYTAKENGTDIGLSIYANDIFKTLGKTITYKPINKQKKQERITHRELIFKDTKIKEVKLNELLGRLMCPKLFYYTTNLGDQICYKDEFLLNFYAKALITNRVFVNLAKMGRDYELNSVFDSEIERVFNISFSEIMKYFDLFSENAVKDIMITSKKSVNDFIDLHIKQGKFAAKHFKFKPGKEKRVKGRFAVVARPTLILVNLDNGKETEFDISKNLDYLVASCGGKKHNFQHFDEIMERLEVGTKLDDKMALVNFASFKVNTQLNNAKYYQDGVERINTLVNDTPNSFSNMNERVSSFCRFCKMKGTCKGVLIDD